MNEPLMPRFNGYTQEEVTAYSQHFDEEKTGHWSFVYGFDHGGIAGPDSPMYGYFIQAWLQMPEDQEVEHNPFIADYHETGPNTVLMESPFWGDIVMFRPDHVQAIVLDLPIPKETNETIKKITEYWKEAGLYETAFGDEIDREEEIMENWEKKD